MVVDAFLLVCLFFCFVNLCKESFVCYFTNMILSKCKEDPRSY